MKKKIYWVGAFVHTPDMIRNTDMLIEAYNRTLAKHIAWLKLRRSYGIRAKCGVSVGAAMNPEDIYSDEYLEERKKKKKRKER